MSKLGAAALLILTVTPIRADEPKTWEGTWVNRKYGTSGTLKCVGKSDENGMWTATFSGKFMTESFTYDVTFRAKPGRGQSDLSGTAKIRNHEYEWAGAIRGDTLTGRYRSNSGYFGEFVLKEKR